MLEQKGDLQTGLAIQIHFVDKADAIRIGRR
jgi:hypothetical protein